MSNNVLIVDNDLGFVFWLGQAFHARGLDAIGSSTATEAALLLSQLGFVPDIVLARLSLPGCARFAANLQVTYPGLRVIQLVGSGETPRCGEHSGIDGWLENPALTGKFESDWLISLDTVLARATGQASSWKMIPSV